MCSSPFAPEGTQTSSTSWASPRFQTVVRSWWPRPLTISRSTCSAARPVARVGRAVDRDAGGARPPSDRGDSPRAVRGTAHDGPSVRRDSREPRRPDTQSFAVSQLSELHRLLRDDDMVTFSEEAKRRVRAAADFHGAMALANQELQPSQTTLPESAVERHALVDDIVQWLVPAFEYRPEWCTRPVLQVVDWWNRNPTTSGHFVLWRGFHQAWVHPVLSTLLAASVAQEDWSAMKLLLNLPTPDDADEQAGH